MVKKFQQTIKLMKKVDGKYKETAYISAEFLPGSVLEKATNLQVKMAEAAENGDAEGTTKALMETYDFVAQDIFEGQFTGEEYREGIDAREIAPLTGRLLQSVTAGYENTYNVTKKK